MELGEYTRCRALCTNQIPVRLTQWGSVYIGKAIVHRKPQEERTPRRGLTRVKWMQTRISTTSEPPTHTPRDAAKGRGGSTRESSTTLGSGAQEGTAYSTFRAASR